MMKTNHHLVRCRLAAKTCTVLGLGFLAASPASALNMWFSNNSTYSPSDIWITVQRGQGFGLAQSGIAAGQIIQQPYVPDINYWNGSASTNLNWRWLTNSSDATVSPWQKGASGSIYSESLQLSYIQTNGLGLLNWISNAPSANVIVSYGSSPFSPYTPTITSVPTSNNYANGAASANASPDPNYRVAWQPFEITYYPTSGDQGDLTAINFFSASLKIQSFQSSSPTGPVLQEGGFYPSGATIGASLSNISSGPVPSGGNLNNPGGPAQVTNTSGDVVRYIGPSQFGVSTDGSWGYGTYQGFDSYFGGAGASNALFSNSSAFNSVPDPGGLPATTPYTNKEVSFAFDNSVTNTANGYALNPTGTITVVTMAYGNGGGSAPTSVTTDTYTGITFNVNPAGIGGASPVISNVASQFVYQGSFTAFSFGTNVYSWFGGPNFTTLSNDLSGWADPSGSPAIDIVTAQIAGEIATGFAAGFVGSTNPLIAGQPSSSWWTNSPTNAFSGATTNTNNYNQYAAVIASASSNTVYGMVYSDRFKPTPLINSYQLNGTNIGSWLITINDPITAGIAVPEPSTYALLAMGGAALAGYMIRRRKR